MSYCNPAVLSMGEQGHYGLDSQRVEEVIGGFIGQVGPTCLAYTGAYSLTGTPGTASATLSWTDPFSTETGWLVEQRQKNGQFKQVKSLPAERDRRHPHRAQARPQPLPHPRQVQAGLRRLLGRRDGHRSLTG